MWAHVPWLCLARLLLRGLAWCQILAVAHPVAACERGPGVGVARTGFCFEVPCVAFDPSTAAREGA